MNQNLTDVVYPGGERFTWHEIIDQQSGMAAGVFSHPSDWQAQSRVVWNLRHTDVPALVFSVAYNPQGVECCEFFPTQGFFWIQDSFGGFGMPPIGHAPHGFVCMPPRPAPDALAGIVIPNYRRNFPGLRVTHARPVPKLWENFNDPPPYNGEGVTVRVEYEMQGLPVEEEFYGTYTWAQGMQLNWGFERVVSFRAQRGRINALRETFWRIAASRHTNPQWKEHFNQVRQQLQAGHEAHVQGTFDRLRRERAMSDQRIAQSNDFLAQREAQLNASLEQEQRRREAERARQEREYTLTDARGDALSGKTAYRDPHDPGNFHYEDSSSQYVWTDGMGNFRPTNDPFEDPNVGGDRQWTRARRADGRE